MNCPGLITATHLSLPGGMQPLVGSGRAPGDAVTAFPDGPTASASSRCYQITHRTVYRYSDVVTSSYGRGFLTPRDSARQRCLSHELIIEPEAADSSTSRDVVRQHQLVLPCHRTPSDVEHHQQFGGRGGSDHRQSSTAVGRRGRRGRSRGRSASTARWPPSSPWTCSRRRSPTSYVPTPHRVSSPAGH